MVVQNSMHLEKMHEEKLSQFLNQLKIKINNFGIWQSNQKIEATYSTYDIEFIFYMNGGASLILDNKLYDCPVGSIVIIEPDKLYTIINQGHDEYGYYYLHFEVEQLHLQSQLIDLLTKNGPVVYQNEIRNFSEILHRLLYEAREQDIGYQTIITSGLIRIIVEIIRAQLKRTHQDFDYKKIDLKELNIINQVLDDINTHLDQPINIQQLSKNIGVSTSTLYKTFQHIFHESPSQYIQKYKIKKSLKLLDENMSLGQIASTLGYCSAYHYSHVFKNIMLLSPSEYKKSKNIHNY